MAHGNADTLAARIDAECLRVVEEVIRRRAAGETLSDEAILATHPQLAPTLRVRLAGLSIVERARAAAKLGGSPAPATLSVPGYRLQLEIGRGGQAVVYEALQESTQRVVALKVMRSTLFTLASDRARFEREVRILARLRHPNIVTIHDSGRCGEYDYFVMERVHGPPLDAYIAERQLPIRSVLALFQTICGAVDSAHLLGVIHRDLKPANIRVDAAGQPRVLDFGLASDLEPVAPAGAETRAATLTGQFLGTAAWASPELAAGGAHTLDVRSDVYAIGVMLFHALLGRFPYDVSGSFHEILERVRTAEPTRPRSLRRDIDADVETILLRCLAKEPQRRYPTAGDVGRDITRYLAGEPIAARRDSLRYVLGKRLRRHRVATALLTLTFLAIVAGVVSSLLLWQRAERHRDVAEANAEQYRTQREESERQRRIAEAVNAFLNDDLLAAAAPSGQPGRGRDVTVLAALQRAKARLDAPGRTTAPFALNREVEAAVRHTLGVTFAALGDRPAAREQLGRALAIRSELRGAHAPETLDTADRMARLDVDDGNYESAIAALERIVAQRRRIGDDVQTFVAIGNLAMALSVAGRTAEALKHYEEALPGASRALGALHRDVLRMLSSYAMALRRAGRLGDAEIAAREAYEARRRAFGDEDLETLGAAHTLAQVYVAQDRNREAAILLEEALPIRERLEGPDHPNTLKTLGTLGQLYQRLERTTEAESTLVAVIERSTRALGPDDPDTLVHRINLAQLLAATGRTQLAIDALVEVLEAQNRTIGAAHPHTLFTINNLASAYMDLGQLELAEPMALRAVTGRTAALGAEHADTLVSVFNLAALRWRQDRLDEAISLTRGALEVQRRILPPDHDDIRSSLEALVVYLIRAKKPGEAEPYARELLAHRLRTLGPEHFESGGAYRLLALALRAQNRFADAAQAFEQARKTIVTGLPPEHRWRRSTDLGLTACWVSLGKFAEAEGLLAPLAEEVCDDPQAAPADKLELIDALIALYERWNQSDPSPEHSDAAVRWRAMRDRVQPATQPRSR